MAVPKELLSALEIDLDELVFVLNALTFPREALMQFSSADKRNTARIHKIYNYLYGFSINRLYQIINCPFMSILIINYYMSNGIERI